MPEFFIGIDFGHGETCVSRVPGTNGQCVSRIPLRRAANFMDQKVWSAICRDENQEWRFVWSEEDFCRPDIREGFKGIIRDLDDDRKEALREFAKLIFTTILNNDPELQYNKKTGEANFVICIANPTDWRRQNSDIPQEYLRFFVDEAGIKPAKMCINESDAAFYTKFPDYGPNATVFVIDLGSSTIDFTTYHNSACIRECCWGYTHLGAHLIEDKLVEFGYTMPDNAANMHRVANEREQRSLGSAKAAVSLAARMVKEDYFTQNRHSYTLALRFRELIPGWPERRETAFSVDLITREDFNNVIEDYITALNLALRNAVQRLEDHGITPTNVLLSGGASRMPFVLELTRQAFPENTSILLDNCPEWVVSDGAAKYAQVHTQALEQAEILKQTFTDWANTDDHLKKMIEEAGLQAFQETLRELMKEGLESYRLNNTENNLTHFEPVLRDILENTTRTPRFKNLADEKFTHSINSQIAPQLKDIIRRQYGNDVTIETSFIDPKENFRGVEVRINRDGLHKRVNTIAYNLFCGCFDRNVNWQRNRSPRERDRLVDEAIRSIPECYTFHFGGHHDQEPDAIIAGMIEEATSKIKEILIANGLFPVAM